MITIVLKLVILPESLQGRVPSNCECKDFGKWKIFKFRFSFGPGVECNKLLSPFGAYVNEVFSHAGSDYFIWLSENGAERILAFSSRGDPELSNPRKDSALEARLSNKHLLEN